MTWREQLRTGASFRGVAFATVDAELRVGRRSVPHEYPQRDLNFVDDLGRRARVFSVEAYVIGDDYLVRRDALITAIEQPGPGELVHPRWGTRQVAVQDYVSVRESPKEGGVARFAITFIEAGANVFPKAKRDTVAEADAASSAVEAAAVQDFASAFSVKGPSVLAEQASGRFQDQLKGLLETARRASDVSTLAAIASEVSSASSTANDLIRTPFNLADSLRAIHGQVLLGALRPLAAFSDLQDHFGRSPRPSAASLATARPGSTRAGLLANEAAQADVQRRLALASQARALAISLQARAGGQPAVATVERALALRDRLLAQIDTELEDNDPPADVGTSLTRLRAAVTRDVSERIELLRRASVFTPATVLPSLWIAHRVYQDATRAEELEERNGIRHPAFVGAKALEILQ